MNNIVQRAIDDFCLVDNGDNIIVALSGGADSVSLLHILCSLKEKYNLSIFACHINHMIRGEEADSDEQFVRNLCEQMGVRLFVKSVDVPTLAKKLRISLELCGRNVRYEFFDELAKKYSAKIATAHTASDNAETVLYNLSRGTSALGLCGIKPRRDNIIRPLIYAARSDVEKYCCDNHLSFVTDSTNASDEYTRNKIRHNAVPVLKQLNPDFENAVSRMCSSMSDIVAFIDKYSLSELNKCKTDNGYSCKKLLELDKAVLSNALYMITKQAGACVDNRHIRLIESALSTGASVDLTGGRRAVCRQGILRIVDLSDSDSGFQQVLLKDYDKVEYYSDADIKKINKNFFNDLIDCDIITDNTVLRYRRAGDNFTLKNRRVTKSLKKLFNELKIPVEKRDKLLVAANNSTVLWIEGIGVSENARVGTQTKRAVRILL